MSLIIHHNGAYNLYSTIADGPIFESAITIKQLEEEIKEEGGRRAMEELPRRLERAHAKGTSSAIDSDLKKSILGNREGLFVEAFIKKYLTFHS